MKTKTMLKAIQFSKTDFDEIANAVATAEKNTTGEIRVAITAESAHYAFWELLVSVFVATIVFAIMLPFSSNIITLYKKFVWIESDWALPLIFGIVCILVAITVFQLVNIPKVDRIIIPRKIRSMCVTHRAFRYFSESGVYDTKEHSGILIFVSYMEKQVRIIADSGISKKISQELWQIITDELVANIKAKKMKDGFINAIQKCGDLLAENFPAKIDNLNELQDGLVILEDSEWY